MKPIYFLILSFLFISCKQPASPEVVKTIEQDKSSGIPVGNSKDETLIQLQGTWFNMDAPTSSLTFANNKVINTYDGVAVNKNIIFSIQDTCGDATAKETPEEKDRYILTSGDTKECYYIVQLDDENLILGFWGEETALRFKKIN